MTYRRTDKHDGGKYRPRKQSVAREMNLLAMLQTASPLTPASDCVRVLSPE